MLRSVGQLQSRCRLLLRLRSNREGETAARRPKLRRDAAPTPRIVQSIGVIGEGIWRKRRRLRPDCHQPAQREVDLPSAAEILAGKRLFGFQDLSIGALKNDLSSTRTVAWAK